MAPPKTHKKDGSSNRKRRREDMSAETSGLSSGKRQSREHIEDPGRYLSAARAEMSRLEIGAPLNASCSEIASMRINAAIDAEMFVLQGAVRSAGDTEKQAFEAGEKFAELAKSRLGEPDKLLKASFESDESSDSELDEEEKVDLREALREQLDAEHEARRELQRLSAEAREWQNASIYDLGISLPSDDLPSLTATANAADTSVREALDLKLIAASSLSDRAGSLRRAVVSAAASRTRLYSAYEASTSSYKRDARRIIRPDSPRHPRSAAGLAPRKTQHKKAQSTSGQSSSSTHKRRTSAPALQHDDEIADDDDDGGYNSG